MNIEKEIKAWKAGLHRYGNLEEGAIEELESHIREEIDRLVENGESPDRAFQKAIDGLGPMVDINNQEGIVHALSNPSMMPMALLRNFLKVNGRQLIKNSSYHVINLVGLSIAFTSLLFIAIFMYDELNYERRHPDAERIYRLSYSFKGEDGLVEKRAFSSGSWPALLKEEIPAIEDYFRFTMISFGYLESEEDNKSFYTEHIYWSDSNFFEFLNFPLKLGNPKHQLKDLSSIILTESSAKKFFGDDNPIGKTLKFVRRNTALNLTVTGVIFDPPSNTHFQPEYIASIHALDDIFGERHRGWITKAIRPGWAFSYVKINDPTAIPLMEQRIKEIWETNLGDRAEAMEPLITPLTDIHFNPPIKWEIDSPIQMSYIYGLGIIGIFILIIVMTNYVNLATAQASKRYKEVGVRRTLGGTKTQLRIQFLLESMITIGAAMIMSLTIVYALLEPFNHMVEKNLDFQSLFLDTTHMLYLSIATVLVSLIGSIYPAFLLTRGTTSSPGSTIRVKETSGLSHMRASLIVVQFTVAITLIICTVTVYNQLQLINKGKLGENRDAIIGVRTTNMGTEHQIQRYKHEIASESRVENSTLGMHLPRQSDFGRIDTRYIIPEQDNAVKYWNKFNADGGFADTYDLEFIAGRDFNKNVDSLSLILNEAAVRSMGIDPHQAIGMKLVEDSINHVYGRSSGTVIGVVRDFSYATVKNKVDPVVICANVKVQGVLSIKLTAGDKQAIIRSLEQKWYDAFPGRPFEYWFLDKEFERLYHQERRLGKLIPLFSGLAICLAMLGLFALISYVTELRKKEIGIRKVLGSSVISILRLLSWQFIRLVLVALALGIPLAWIGMNQWLEGFAYRVSVNGYVILITAGFILLTSLMTIGIRSIRAATDNPVNSLKYE